MNDPFSKMATIESIANKTKEDIYRHHSCTVLSGSSSRDEFPEESSERPINEVDYRPQGGPHLRYLWCKDEGDGPSGNNQGSSSVSLLRGQTLYLGGEVGSDGKIYFIPGHAPQVLRLDPQTDKLSLIGPSFHGKFKWLRGVVVGNIIYGLPCNADSVLRIDCQSGSITTLSIPYEDSFPGEQARNERNCPWKYHGGDISPHDNCIYAIPQSATRVLKINPFTDTCSFVGISLPGKYKFYGGVIGKQDGAIYGICHDSRHVLRIGAEGKVTLHGDFGEGGHKWHGAAVARDGTIVCVPANADTVLCIVPADPEPKFYELGDQSKVQTGRHRSDNKYKYLGAMTGTDGKVYVFPSGSEHVLQVDTEKRELELLPPNIYDENLERICQNKWQNGLTYENKVYGIPLAAESLLTIDTDVKPTPKVSTWPLPQPHQGLAKFEGGVVGPNGILYTVPNNHKAVLRIQPPNHPSEEEIDENNCLTSEAISSNSHHQQVSPPRTAPPPDQKGHLIYQSGIPTLRSSAHRVKFDPKRRFRDNPKPKDAEGQETGTLWLPAPLLKQSIISYDESSFELPNALAEVLKKCDPDIVGCFREGSSRLEDFVVPPKSTWRMVNGGTCEESQKYLSSRVNSDTTFLQRFDELVELVVIPWLKQRLVESGALSSLAEKRIYYVQRPPTLRLQPGPAWSQVKAHCDAEYGHQNGELNFWVPFTDRELNNVDLWCETTPGADDFRRIMADQGDIISFHGSSCRHFVNANTTQYTRVSMDFRVGIQGYFDPHWQMKGTTDDHGRREVFM